MAIFFSFSDAGTINVFLYQPVPPRRAPPPVPVGLALSKGNSILQSCGRFSVRHAASLMFGSLYALKLSNLNFHPSLNCFFELCCAFNREKNNKGKIVKIKMFLSIVL